MAQPPSTSRRSDRARGTPFRFAAILATVGLLVASCGSNAGGTPGSSASAGTASQAPAISPATSVGGTLTVWAMGNEGVLLKALGDSFMKANPGVTVTVVPVSWDQAVAKLQTAIAGHQTPDVSQMGTDMMGQFAATKALEPVPANIQPSAFFESAWNTNIVNGTVYGVPWYVDTRLLYYRADIATKAGITSPPATWADLTAMAKAMQSKGGAKWGISLGTNNWQEYLPFLWSNGGDVMDAQGKFQLNSPQAVEALTFYESFFKAGLTPKAVPAGFDITPAFVAGTNPMFFSGPWHLGLIKKAGGAGFDSKWAIAPMPKKVSSTSFVGGSNFVVYKDSKNKDAAWKFVQYLADPKTQVVWYGDAADLPAVQAAWDDPTLKADKNLAMFGQQLKDTKAQPAISTWSELATALNGTLEKMTTAGLDPKAAADEMQKEAETIGTGQ
ncbi:MAG: extracellular solute-binding protein [Candidatus Limnocylindrales bacterium]